MPTVSVDPNVYWYAFGLFVLFALLALLMVRLGLRRWVRALRHPKRLRWLVAGITMGAFMVLAAYLWFWPLLRVIPLAPDPVLGRPLAFWLITGLWLMTLIIAVRVAMRPHRPAHRPPGMVDV